MFRRPVASAGAGSGAILPRLRASARRSCAPIYTAPEEEPDDEPEPPPPEPIAVPLGAAAALRRRLCGPPRKAAPCPPAAAAGSGSAGPGGAATAAAHRGGALGRSAPPERAAAVPIHPDEDHTWPAATRPAETITSVVSQLRLPGALGRAGRCSTPGGRPARVRHAVV